jgi:hypothetical protein
MVTVGGWTIAVGKFALLFQLLVFIQNLYEAGVARNAAELQRSSDRMSTDISSAGNVVLQMGMAKLAFWRPPDAGGILARGGAAWAGSLRRVPGRVPSAVRRGSIWRRAQQYLKPMRPGVLSAAGIPAAVCSWRPGPRRAVPCRTRTLSGTR